MNRHSERKKVIFITNVLGNGGSGRVMSTIASYLAENEYNVEVYSFLNNYETYKISNKIKSEVIKCKSKNIYLKKIERILKLRKIFKYNKDATIIAFEYFVNMQTIIASLFLKNKVIISERNDPSKHGNKFFVNELRHLLYRYTDILVCQTNDAKEYFKHSIQKKTIVIPNPIMSNLPDRFDGIRKKEIVTFCRIEPQKNLKLMIDAFTLINKEYPDYTLSIYGDGSEKQKLVEYVNEINLDKSINFYGFTDNIHSKIIDKAMFVSSSDYEGISNSMLEAMSIGLPCVVTDCPCGGARMMIENNINGVLTKVGDVYGMYNAMKNIIENKQLSDELSINASKIKEKLDQDKICAKWKKIV